MMTFKCKNCEVEVRCWLVLNTFLLALQSFTYFYPQNKECLRNQKCEEQNSLGNKVYKYYGSGAKS